MFGFKGPRAKVLGVEFAGVIEETGAGVTRFKPGDAVFGLTGMAQVDMPNISRSRPTVSLPGSLKT